MFAEDIKDSESLNATMEPLYIFDTDLIHKFPQYRYLPGTCSDYWTCGPVNEWELSVFNMLKTYKSILIKEAIKREDGIAKMKLSHLSLDLEKTVVKRGEPKTFGFGLFKFSFRNEWLEYEIDSFRASRIMDFCTHLVFNDFTFDNNHTLNLTVFVPEIKTEPIAEMQFEEQMALLQSIEVTNPITGEVEPAKFYDDRQNEIRYDFDRKRFIKRLNV